jgi:hypothetical protein
VLKGLLLVALLVVHFLTRQQTAKTMVQHLPFYHDSHNYLVSYRSSLGLLAGQGFCRIGLPSDHPSVGSDEVEASRVPNKSGDPSVASPPPPEAKPILEFFKLQRLKITRDEFEAYLQIPQAEPIPVNPDEPIRILDIHFTALIWRIFGISWPVYFTFASLASSFCCFVIFLMTRKLTCSYWAGMLAGLLFLAFPFENQYAIRSVRDISPLWFASLAFGFFICVVDNFRARKWNYLTYLVLGALTIVGVGWRQDAFLVAPFLLAGLMIYIFCKHWHWRRTLVAGCLFVIGGGAMHLSIQSLGPRGLNPSGHVFHVALFGDASRCNVMALENSFQVQREDFDTFCNAAWFHQTRDPGTHMAYLDRRYGVVCREMYTASMKYHLFQYLRYWPEFYLHALGAMSKSGQLQGESLALLHQSRLPWALPIYEWCLDYLIAGLPFLHIMGILTLFWVGRDKIRGSFLAFFSLYYSVIWFAALPEQKHLGQMLLPLAVTGGLGLWGLARTLRFFLLHLDLRDLPLVIPRHARIAGWAALGVALSWGFACAFTYRYSIRQRDHYVNEIMELADRGTEANKLIKDPRVFAVLIDPRKPGPLTGYFLTIKASTNPGLLTCRHVQFPSRRHKGRILVTHHRLYPGRVQYFAVSCIHSEKFCGDFRSYACTVTLPPDCSIVGCKQLDLTSWKRLPFSTVFYYGEHLPGSPVVGRYPDGEPPSDRYFEPYSFNNLSSEIAYAYPWHLLTVLGLPFDQNFDYPGLRPVQLATRHDEQEHLIQRSPWSLEEGRQFVLSLEGLHEEPGVYADQQTDGLHLRIPFGQTGPIATYSPLVVRKAGYYLLKVKYRQSGSLDLVMQAGPAGDFPASKQQCLPYVEDDLPVRFLEVRLNAGEPLHFQLVNQAPPGNDGAEIVIQEIHAYREKYPLWKLSQ